MLNPQQYQAVQTIKGRVLILAGAGSGKTSVLTHRIAHLINSHQIPPSQILGLTFTNKAAEEMGKRVASMVSTDIAKQLTLCTFHSFCMQILRKEIEKLGYTRQFSLYDERDIRRLLNYLVREELQHNGELPNLDPTIQWISMARNQSKAAEEIEGDALSKKLYHQLQTLMRACNAVDFDHLLFLTLQLFKEHPEVLIKYQNRYQYIMIDEYQDTNPIQYQLAHLLSEGHQNLCVVGDDDQAIYTWRGAEVKNILNFQASTTIRLEQNYRSSPEILQAANGLIRHNRERHQKELWSNYEKGEKITIFHAPTEEEEAQAIVQKIIGFHQYKNLNWKDTAILYRSNILSRPLELALLQASWKEGNSWRRGIPYQIIGGTEFAERSEIKDLAAYLRVIMNPLDQEAILRIINVPRRGISDQALDKVTQYNRKHQKSVFDALKEASSIEGLSERACKGIEMFLKIISQAQDQFSKNSIKEGLRWLVETINYRKAVEEEVKSEKGRSFKWENVEAFIQNSDTYSDIHDLIGSLALYPPAFNKVNDVFDPNRVQLMTFHSAKGLEFDVCFLVGIEDQVIPHEKSLYEGRLEEERRLLYVAITRAKKHLFLSMARTRKKQGKDVQTTPSRFLFEIPKETLQAISWKEMFQSF